MEGVKVGVGAAEWAIGNLALGVMAAGVAPFEGNSWPRALAIGVGCSIIGACNGAIITAFSNRKHM